ncbi:UNVERIFIED_CONTAM: hypothetical protein FKN15_020429 [Acipenser sinensis]
MPRPHHTGQLAAPHRLWSHLLDGMREKWSSRCCLHGQGLPSRVRLPRACCCSRFAWGLLLRVLLLLGSPPEGPASPGVTTSPATQQEILWLEPHTGELPARKKGWGGQNTSSPRVRVAVGYQVAGAPKRGASGQEVGGGQETSSTCSNFAAGERVAGAPRRGETVACDPEEGAAGHREGGAGLETTPTSSWVAAKITLAGGAGLCTVSLAATVVGVGGGHSTMAAPRNTLLPPLPGL